jgi:hypothetical protein
MKAKKRPGSPRLGTMAVIEGFFSAGLVLVTLFTNTYVDPWQDTSDEDVTHKSW